jgi:hypothetical protein
MSESFNKFKPVTIKALRGNSESYAFDLKNSAGSAYVISGTVTLTVKRNKNDTTALFTASITDGANGNIWAQGRLVAIITAAQSATLPDAAYFDIKQDVGGVITTLPAGRIVAYDTPD